MLNLNTSEKNWASTTAARFEHKLRAVRERSAEKIPNRAVDGVHNNKIFVAVSSKSHLTAKQQRGLM